MVFLSHGEKMLGIGNPWLTAYHLVTEVNAEPQNYTYDQVLSSDGAPPAVP